MRSDGAPHHVVLLGGGHTHALALAAFARRPESRLRLTLVTDRPRSVYSGMAPGLLAGVYAPTQIEIDLPRLAARAGAAIVLGRAHAVDAKRREVAIEGAPPVSYDTLSINVGVAPDVSAIAGAERHALLVKPIAGFFQRLETTLAAAERGDGPRRFVVVGGGLAGVEIACAMVTRLDAIASRCGFDASRFGVTLASADGVAVTMNARAQRLIDAALRRRGVRVEPSFRVSDIFADRVRADDGRVIPADATLVATAARAPEWLARSGFPCAPDGSAWVEPTLQALGREEIFVVGDCAALKGQPLAKAGVFAVRQAPTLVHNLRARLDGASMRPFRPQAAFLTLASTADGRAIAARGRHFAAEGWWVWRWKDAIDRRFVAQFA